MIGSCLSGKFKFYLIDLISIYNLFHIGTASLNLRVLVSSNLPGLVFPLPLIFALMPISVAFFEIFPGFSFGKDNLPRYVGQTWTLKVSELRSRVCFLISFMIRLMGATF